MSNLFNVLGKIISTAAKEYGKKTAKKREKEDAKAAVDKEQKPPKNCAIMQ